MKQFTTYFILIISFYTFAQSPWTKEKGRYYTQVSFTSIPNYNTLFGDPEQKLLRNITDNTLQFYGEYGLTDKTTLLLNLPFKFIKTVGNDSDNNTVLEIEEGEKNSLGNIEIGIKHNFYKKDWLISSQLTVEVNTNTFANNTGIRTGYNAFTISPLILVGRGYGKSYLQTFIGIHIRTKNYSSNFKVGGEYGRKLTQKLWLIGFLDIVKSFENGDVELPSSNLLTGLYVNNQEYGGFGFKGIYEINKSFGINAGLGGAFFGNNVAKQGAFTFGVYRKF